MVMSSAKPHKKFLILDDGIKIPQAQVNPTSEKTDHQDSPAIASITKTGEKKRSHNLRFLSRKLFAIDLARDFMEMHPLQDLCGSCGLTACKI
ncbi:hypothetical protein Peur_030078 [Populus x canadensis]